MSVFTIDGFSDRCLVFFYEHLESDGEQAADIAQCTECMSGLANRRKAKSNLTRKRTGTPGCARVRGVSLSDGEPTRIVGLTGGEINGIRHPTKKRRSMYCCFKSGCGTLLMKLLLSPEDPKLQQHQKPQHAGRLCSRRSARKTKAKP